jgi:hypothetical protein
MTAAFRARLPEAAAAGHRVDHLVDAVLGPVDLECRLHVPAELRRRLLRRRLLPR